MVEKSEESSQETTVDGTEKDIEYVLSHGGSNKSVYTTGRVATKQGRSSKKVRLLYEVQPSNIKIRDPSNTAYNLWVDPSELFAIDLTKKPFEN